MKKTFSHIRNLFFKPEAPQTLAYFRIAVSAFGLVQLFVLLPDWMWLYGPKGLLPWEISDALNTNGTPSLLFASNLLAHVHISPTATVYLVTIIYFLSLTALLIGFKTRVMAITAWLMHLMINTTGHFTAYGVESFLHIALFYCAVLPVGYCLSIDAIKKRTVIPPYLITLSVRIIQLHLCMMYLASGIEKSLGGQWWSGEAVWLALQQDQFHKFDTGWMAQIPILPKLLCWGTLLAETFYPIGIFYKKTKKVWLISIMSMHAFIALFLGLQLFGALMTLLNLTAFGNHSFNGLFLLKWKNIVARVNMHKAVFVKQPAGL